MMDDSLCQCFLMSSGNSFGCQSIVRMVLPADHVISCCLVPANSPAAMNFTVMLSDNGDKPTGDRKLANV